MDDIITLTNITAYQVIEITLYYTSVQGKLLNNLSITRNGCSAGKT